MFLISLPVAVKNLGIPIFNIFDGIFSYAFSGIFLFSIKPRYACLAIISELPYVKVSRQRFVDI